MINGAWLHLSINHVPVVGFPICFVAFAAGFWRRSKDLIQAGFVAMVFLAIISGVAWKSGGPAAHTLFNFPGASVEKMAVHAHAEAAEYGAVVAGILGVLGLVGWWLSMRPQGAPSALVVLAILGTLFASVTMARVAHLGGLIRHPEIAAAPAAQ